MIQRLLPPSPPLPAHRMPRLLLLLILAASAVDTAWLAPTLAEHHEHEAALLASLAETTAVLEAIARLHNEWTTHVPPGGAADLCAKPTVAALGLQAGAFLRATPPLLNRLSTRLERHVATTTAATVAPLLHPEAGAELAATEAKVSKLRARLDEAHAWQALHVAPHLRGCAAPAGELPGVGRDPYTVGPVAVLVAGGGYVCPLGVPADGRVVTVDGPICLAPTSACACAPEPVTPGSIVLLGAETDADLAAGAAPNAPNAEASAAGPAEPASQAPAAAAPPAEGPAAD